MLCIVVVSFKVRYTYWQVLHLLTQLISGLSSVLISSAKLSDPYLISAYLVLFISNAIYIFISNYTPADSNYSGLSLIFIFSATPADSTYSRVHRRRRKSCWWRRWIRRRAGGRGARAPAGQPTRETKTNVHINSSDYASLLMSVTLVRMNCLFMLMSVTLTCLY